MLVGQPGGVFTLLALVTALTLPCVNLVFPAACALAAHAAALPPRLRRNLTMLPETARVALVPFESAHVPVFPAARGADRGALLPLNATPREPLLPYGTASRAPPGGGFSSPGKPPLAPPRGGRVRQSPGVRHELRGRFELSRGEWWQAVATLVVGLACLVIAWYAALGRALVGSVRGPEVIGCAGWGIWKSPGMQYAGLR